MAYQSLYRRYRPRRFSEVRGQEHVVRALRNAVRDDRVGHAYLFSGPRGTGKTSTARILAKALNCENLVEGEPDGTCESCQAIEGGTSYDVQELDAASNRGVEEIRDLISRVALGSPGRTKVYILDEVHMLTPAASAALLKTLEEPPEHVVFVLATTDPHKVLPTIRSRTQHFDFHLLGADELAEHVAWIIHDAELDLSPDVIDHVVRAGGGSARDTLSALERVAAAGGAVDEAEPVDELLEAIAASDVPRALVAVADAVTSGRDPRVLGEAVLARLRDVFLVRMGASTDHLPTGDVARVQAWADQLGDRATTRALEAVGDALLEMRQAPDPRIPLEVAMVKLAQPASSGASIEALEARIARLEAALASGGAPPAPTGDQPAPPAVDRDRPAPSTPTPTPDPPARPSGRPADLARAELAAQRAEKTAGRSGPAPRTSAAPSSPAPRGSAAPPSPPASPSNPSPSATPPPPVSTAPAAPPGPAAEPAASTIGGGEVTLERVSELWAEGVLPSLKGLTKAMYAAGRVSDVADGQVTVAVPSEPHREKCRQKQPEVEAALTQQLGHPVRLELVVDGSGGGPGGPRPARSAGPASSVVREASASVEDFDVLGGADVHDLDDAPGAPAGGIDAVIDAFPGAEVIEGG